MGRKRVGPWETILAARQMAKLVEELDYRAAKIAKLRLRIEGLKQDRDASAVVYEQARLATENFSALEKNFRVAKNEAEELRSDRLTMRQALSDAQQALALAKKNEATAWENLRQHKADDAGRKLREGDELKQLREDLHGMKANRDLAVADGNKAKHEVQTLRAECEHKKRELSEALQRGDTLAVKTGAQAEEIEELKRARALRENDLIRRTKSRDTLKHFLDQSLAPCQFPGRTGCVCWSCQAAEILKRSEKEDQA